MSTQQTIALNNWAAFALGVVTLPLAWFVINLMTWGWWTAFRPRTRSCLARHDTYGTQFERTGWNVYTKARFALHKRIVLHRKAIGPWTTAYQEMLRSREES